MALRDLLAWIESGGHVRHEQQLDLLLNRMENMMAAIDDLRLTIADAVREMTIAADTVRGRPSAANDPQLADLNAQLASAMTALRNANQTAPTVVLPPAQPAPVEAGATSSASSDKDKK